MHRLKNIPVLAIVANVEAMTCVIEIWLQGLIKDVKKVRRKDLTKSKLHGYNSH